MKKDKFWHSVAIRWTKFVASNWIFRYRQSFLAYGLIFSDMVIKKMQLINYFLQVRNNFVFYYFVWLKNISRKKCWQTFFLYFYIFRLSCLIKDVDCKSQKFWGGNFGQHFIIILSKWVNVLNLGLGALLII